MKTVIVTPQIPLAFRTGGIGTFTWNFTRLLKLRGDNVDIIFTRRPEVETHIWQAPFAELGVPVECIDEERMPLHVPIGYSRYQAIAETVAERIPTDTDVVYFADWEANGLHIVRSRRFTPNKLPVCVTVLHGGSKWSRQGMATWPETYDDLALDFHERYTIEHSDFIAAPSQFILDWARDNGWALPASGSAGALGLPMLPEPDLAPVTAPAAAFDRMVFFGRLDTCKGIDLFVESVVALNARDCLKSVKEIVLLGGAGQNIYGSTENVVQRLQSQITPIHVTAYTDLSSHQAQLYLAEHASTTLVVVPSRADTLSYSVIEASLIPNLNLICSDAGGIPEVFGSQKCDQLFEPHVDSLVDVIDQWTQAGPRDASRLCSYDWEAANQRWLAFHEEVCTYARSIHSPLPSDVHSNGVISASPERGARVDVCIPYYNLGEFLPQLLTTLDAQTTQEFDVFLVNDGSTDPKSIGTFADMAEHYQYRKNWTFVSTEHKGVCHARNLAASMGHANYLCFIDADNLARPDMIKRFLDSISESGDDCLTCNMYCFEGDGTAATTPSRSQPHPILRTFHIVPVGNCPALGILHNPYGDGNCIIRRSVFEELGGFTTDVPNYVNHEDRELLTRLSLAGYKLDVIPEFLAKYRLRADGRLRITDNYLNDRRVVRHYEALLRQLGLEDLAPITVGQYYAAKKQAEKDPPPGAERVENWGRVTAEQKAQIDELRAWADELKESAKWHEQQNRAWEQVAHEHEARIAELESWTSELNEAMRWHEQQSRAWEQVARERQAQITSPDVQDDKVPVKLLSTLHRLLAAVRKQLTAINRHSNE